MRASASGSFGAFLIIAPLVAIPVLATVGVPQFAPALSRARDSFDAADLSDLRVVGAQPETAPPSRSAEDLFQPVRTLGEPASAADSLKVGDPRKNSDLALPLNSLGQNSFGQNSMPPHSGASQVGASQAGATQSGGSLPRASLPAEAVAGWAIENELLPVTDTGSGSAPSWNPGADRAATPITASDVSGTATRPAAARPLRVWAAEQGLAPQEGSPRPMATRRGGVREIPDESAVAPSSLTEGPAHRGALLADRGRGLTSTSLDAADSGSSLTGTSEIDPLPRPTLSTATRALFPHDTLQSAKPPPVRPLPESSAPGTQEPAIRTVGSARNTRGADVDASAARRLEDSASTGSGSAERMTWSRLYQRLRELGVRNPRLEPLENDAGYAFSCTLFPTGQTRVAQRFEAEDADPLTAALQVLQQLEEWTAQR